MSPTTPRLWVACGLLWDGPQVLLVQRGPQQHHAGQWEFPGGKLEPGETGPACLKRELREELGIEVTVGKAHQPVERPFEQGGTLVLLPYDCQLVSGILQLIEHQALAWVTLAAALSYDLSASDRRIVQQLLA